jgi:hypothetical protein
MTRSRMTAASDRLSALGQLGSPRPMDIASQLLNGEGSSVFDVGVAFFQASLLFFKVFCFLVI